MNRNVNGAAGNTDQERNPRKGKSKKKKKKKCRQMPSASECRNSSQQRKRCAYGGWEAGRDEAGKQAKSKRNSVH